MVAADPLLDLQKHDYPRSILPQRHLQVIARVSGMNLFGLNRLSEKLCGVHNPTDHPDRMLLSVGIHAIEILTDCKQENIHNSFGSL